MPSHFVSKKIPSRLKYADTGRRSDVPDNARTCAHTPRHTQTQTDGHTHMHHCLLGQYKLIQCQSTPIETCKHVCDNDHKRILGVVLLAHAQRRNKKKKRVHGRYLVS